MSAISFRLSPEDSTQFMSDNPEPIKVKRASVDLSVEGIRPAFSSNRSAGAFLILLIITLALPKLISTSGAIARRDSYAIMPENQGNYSMVAEEIFENDEPIDLLFIGSSLIWNAIDTPAVQAELSRNTGGPARVITFGHYFNSFDITYTELRDLLERKRVRMVAISIPRTPFTPGPSTTAYRFIRFDDHPEVVAGLPIGGRASLYACSILRSPRDLLTISRANGSGELRFADTLGADRAEFGMGRKIETYEPFLPAPPNFSPETLIYSAETADKFRFIEKPLPKYQDHYLDKLVALLRAKGVPLIIVNVPQYSEIHDQKVIERENWSLRFGTDTPVIGIPPAELYAGLTDPEITKLHYDPEHMNANGNAYYTRAILPAIIKLFNSNAAKNR